MESDHIEGHSSFAPVRIIPYTLRPILLHQAACLYCSQTIWFFRATIFFDEINQLLPVPHICVPGLALDAGSQVIVAIWHSTNDNQQSGIWQLWEVTSRIFDRALSRIHCRSPVASPSLLPCLPNLACTILQKHLNPLSPNPFGII